MIGHSLFKLLAVRTLIFGLEAVTPICFGIVLMNLLSYFDQVDHLNQIWSSILPFIWLRNVILVWSGFEVAFWFYIHFRRIPFIQKDLPRPQTNEASRSELFHRCLSNGGDRREFWEGWFLGAKLEDIKLENVKRWLIWAIFNSDCDSFYSHPQAEKMKEEMNGYIRFAENKMGYKFEEGYNEKVKSIRLNVDPVVIKHRPLLIYACIGLVDSLSQLVLRSRGFNHYVQPNPVYRPFLPFDPFRPQGSSNSKISFWHKPADPSLPKTNPILFIHGIGTGLHTFHWIMHNVAANSPGSDIFLVELMHVSMRFVEKIPLKEDTLDGIEKMLKRWDHKSAVVVGHSLGTVVAAWICRDRPHLISHLLLVDPVCIMLHLPDVAHNFVYREPKRANEWVIWWFASRESGIAWSLGKSFFWSENVLWEDQIPDVKRVVIFLAEEDIIVPCKDVYAYLLEGSPPSKKSDEETITFRYTKKGVKVHWCWGIDHAACIFQHRQLLIKTLTEMGQGIESKNH